jgi:hypothetical protein
MSYCGLDFVSFSPIGLDSPSKPREASPLSLFMRRLGLTFADELDFLIPKIDLKFIS